MEREAAKAKLSTVARMALSYNYQHVSICEDDDYFSIALIAC
jgi:hypothetical protein